MRKQNKRLGVVFLSLVFVITMMVQSIDVLNIKATVDEINEELLSPVSEDDLSNDLEESDYVLSANNFMIGSHDVDTQDKATQLIQKAEVRAYRKSDGSELTPYVINDASYSPAVGGYTVEFGIVEITEAKTKIITSVYGDTTYPIDDYMINIEDFYIHKSKVTGEQDFFDMNYGNVQAWNQIEVGAPATIVISNNTSYEIGAEVGSYGVEIGIAEYSDYPISFIIATVYDQERLGSVDFFNNGFVIGGNDVYLTLDDAQSVAVQDLMNLAKVRAWQIDHYSKETETVLVDTNYTSEIGEYTATFAVKDEQENTVSLDIKVLDASVIVDDEEFVLSAKNLKVPLTKALEIMDETELISLANSKAWIKQQGLISKERLIEKPEIEIESTSFEKEVGEYILNLRIKESPSTKVSVSVEVYDDIPPEAPGVNPLTVDDRVISGTGEIGASITVVLPDDTVVYTQVDSSGKWSVETTKLKVGDIVVVTQTDASGNVSEPTKTEVKDITIPTNPQTPKDPQKPIENLPSTGIDNQNHGLLLCILGFAIISYRKFHTQNC